MKTNVTQYDFERAFLSYGRENQFTYEGKKALYEWLIDFEDDTGQEVELDVISLCCDFSEYEDMAEFQRDYNTNSDGSSPYQSMEDVYNETTVIPVNGEAFIIQAF